MQRLPVYGQLDCFQYSACMNNVAVNTLCGTYGYTLKVQLRLRSRPGRAVSWGPTPLQGFAGAPLAAPAACSHALSVLQSDRPEMACVAFIGISLNYEYFKLFRQFKCHFTVFSMGRGGLHVRVSLHFSFGPLFLCLSIFKNSLYTKYIILLSGI